ncbi:flagellar filament capping protein FliD [Halomonas sp. HL-93]|uniref:flagellar filament capping protein FliD n=1 Tax=Halomonas sp. HL-93 TaxID=1666906 RepID=UPI0007F0ADB2|nr:flagellar filament capping protein FliD [Halomonas sp. HL-93]SBR46091.1 flagellar hook-associated protein 2 [Halomonas sp. HL-93]
MSSISSLGVGSGLDLNGLLGQLQESEQAKLEPIQQQAETEEAQISAYGQLKSDLSQFQSAAEKLNDPATFESLSTDVEGSGVSAVSSDDAQPGQYNVQVDQLASAGSLVTERLDTSDEAVIDGDQSLSFNLAEGDIDPISIADGSSLEDMRDAVNTQSDGRLNASIVNDGDGYRLAVNSTETGAASSIESTNFSDILSADAQTSDAQVVQAGEDAAFNVNGIDITSPTNQVEDAIQGVTLNLTEAGSSSTVTVEQDSDSIREQVTAFVDDYNALKGTIGELTAFDSESGEAADLSGDNATRAVESSLRTALSSVVDGDGFNVLSDAGISLELDGTLAINEDELDSAIANQPNELASFFAGDSENSGLAGQVSTAIEQQIGTNGRLEGAITSSESQLERLGERFSTTEERINTTVERYREEFSALDSMVGDMNQTSAYLTEQLG